MAAFSLAEGNIRVKTKEKSPSGGEAYTDVREQSGTRL